MSALTDLRDRTAEANFRLLQMACRHSNPNEAKRITAKAAGVRLALSYINEAIDAEKYEVES